MTHSTIVSTDVLARHIQSNQQQAESWVVFDCRNKLRHDYYLSGHIPGAFCANIDTDLSSSPTAESGRHPLPEPQDLVQKLRAAGVSKHSQVVVYDDVSGAMAVRMWWLLRWLGHDKVAVLDGGLKKWCAEGKPLDTGAEAVVAEGDFTGTANDNLWIPVEELESLLGQDDVAVIDSRPRIRYRGEEEPLDKEAGHIPGSVNHPLTDNLDSNGCFLPAEVLRGLFKGLRKPLTIHSCSSGVTACHNMLAMEIAGMSGSKLYVGSWSEWIQSPHRRRMQGPNPDSRS